ncbi:hypothetical protein PWT90_04121 [Aphanocladium album]|nr:hypothetical protein PWT90_04121 [Aphanocladium album]
MQLLPGVQQMAFGSPNAAYELHREPAPECGEALRIDYESAPQHSEAHPQTRTASSGVVSLDFADASWSHAISMPESRSRIPSADVPPSPTSLDQPASEIVENNVAIQPRPSCTAQAADSVSVAQTKIISKACGMVEELKKLYDLGVELELLRQESHVPVYLDEVERLIRLSGQRVQSGPATEEDRTSV